MVHGMLLDGTERQYVPQHMVGKKTLHLILFCFSDKPGLPQLDGQL